MQITSVEKKTLPDWHLSRDLAKKIFLRLGQPEIDLMATSQSKQTARFYSALLDEEAEQIDAFTQDWGKFSLAYIFPPTPLIILILKRIYQFGLETRFIVITPWAPKASWFPKALRLALIDPIRLPLSQNTVVDLANSNIQPRTPKGNKIKFVAWLLSGRAGRNLEDCPLGLSQSFSLVGRKELRKAMDWDLVTTPSIAENLDWKNLNRIQ